MTFGLKLSGDLKVPVYFRMTNGDVNKAIREEIALQGYKLTEQQQNALKTYLKGLENDNLFVDPCDEEMILEFGFEK